MEMEINVINNKIFTKFFLKIRVRGKEISHNISVSSRKQTTWNNRSTDYSKSENLPDKKRKNGIPIVMKTFFSEGKLTKEFRTMLVLAYLWPLVLQTRTKLRKYLKSIFNSYKLRIVFKSRNKLHLLLQISHPWCRLQV